jgi:molybdate-binding protein
MNPTPATRTNALEDFTLSSLLKIKEEQRQALILQQADAIVNALKAVLDIRLKHVVVNRNHGCFMNDDVQPENVTHLNYNGFRVWKVGRRTTSGARKHLDDYLFITWGVDDFNDILNAFASTHQLDVNMFVFVELKSDRHHDLFRRKIQGA